MENLFYLNSKQFGFCLKTVYYFFNDFKKSDPRSFFIFFPEALYLAKSYWQRVIIICIFLNYFAWATQSA